MSQILRADECVTCADCTEGDDPHLACPDCGRMIIADDWCYGHMRPEPNVFGAYQICGECFHVFVTAEGLQAAYDELAAELALPPRTVGEIFACPVCAHDF